MSTGTIVYIAVDPLWWEALWDAALFIIRWVPRDAHTWALRAFSTQQVPAWHKLISIHIVRNEEKQIGLMFLRLCTIFSWTSACVNRHVSNHPIKSFYYVNNCQLMEKKSFLKKVTKVTHISRQGTRQGGRMTQISWEFEGTVEKESWRKEACMHMAMGSRRWQRGMPH